MKKQLNKPPKQSFPGQGFTRFSRPGGRSLAGVLFLALSLFRSFAQEEIGIPFSAEFDRTWEAVSIPTQLAPLFSGKVEQVRENGILSISSSSENPGFALGKLSGPAYLEVYAPSQHPWRGHRLEVATGTQSTGEGLTLRILASPRNTQPLVDASLRSAEFRIFPHVSIPPLLEKNIRRTLRRLPQTDFRLYAPTETGFREFRPRLIEPQGKIIWNYFDPDFGWTAENLDGLVLAPGDCFVLRNSHGQGLGFSLFGLQRNDLPCARPWKGKGPHLLSYPYSADLRLGLDWPARGGPLRPSETATDCDYLGLYLPAGYRTFGFFGRDEASAYWREILNPGTRRASWGTSVGKLSVIPAGQGFLLYPRKDGPTHRFDPPLTPN